MIMSVFKNEGEDSIFLQFLRDSSIHGVKYLAQRNRPYAERICWILILLTSLVASGFFIYGVIQKYNRNPIIVSFQPSQTSVDDVPFASVTICSANRFKKSALENFFVQAKSEDEEEAKIAHLALRHLDHVCSLSNTFSNFFNYSMDETTVNACERFGLGCGNHTDGFTMAYKLPDVAMLQISKAFMSCKDMIPLCLWEGQKQNCDYIFQQFVTDMGLCCSYNAAPREYILKNAIRVPGSRPLDKGEDKFWKSFNIDDLLQSDRSSNAEYEEYLKFQSKAGQGSGLSFLINTDIDEYFCDNHDSYGFRIHTHSPIDIPHVAEFGVSVGPSVEMFVSLQADITKAAKEIESLPVRRRNCYYSHEYPLGSFYFYTKSNCLDQCIGEEIAKRCGCVRMDMELKFTDPSFQNVTFCEGVAFKCAKRVMIGVSKNGTDHVCPHCKPSCNKIEYIAQMSSLPLKKDFTIKVQQSEEDRRKGPADNLVRKNASIVHIFFGSDNVYSRIRKNLYGFDDLFAHIGGILGLFLGLSVVSVVEPINMMFRKLFRSQTEQEEKKQPEIERNQHFYAKSPPTNYNSHVNGDSWRKKYSAFGSAAPETRVYPYGYTMHRY